MKKIVYVLCLLANAACTVSPPVKIEAPVDVLPVEIKPVVVDRKVTIAAVGDMMFGGTAAPTLEREGYDYPFAATRHLFSDADIVIGNLETPLTNRGEQLVEKKYRFRNPPDKVAPALKRAGFDIVSLANNHTMDYGVQGLQDTMEALDKVGIRYHGAGMNLAEARKPVLMVLPNGQRVGFLAYSSTFPEEYWAGKNRPGTAFSHERHVRDDVRELKPMVDVVVVSFHWGVENSTQLRYYQPLLARAAIDEGASLIIGHHPHILQAVERYKDGLILYSLGNYSFGSFSSNSVSSVVANITIDDRKFASLELTPIHVNNFKVYFQPQVFSGVKAEAVYQDLKNQSNNAELMFLQNQGVISIPGSNSEFATTP